MHDFEQAHCRLTLREGLAEYRLKNPGLLRGESLSPDAAAFFRCHDAAHVVFGCGTTLAHEAVVKLASIFGTTGGFGVLRGYRQHEAFDMYRALDVSEVLITIAISPWIVTRTLWRCWRQTQRWPWAGFDVLLDRPLSDLRAEYGIRLPGRWG
jgi:hypothetical protein